MSSFGAAIGWIVGLTTGQLGVLLLSISVIALGYLFMSGRILLGRAGLAVIGGFVLLGSNQIANSFVTLVLSTSPAPLQHLGTVQDRVGEVRDLQEAGERRPSQQGNPFDPYSGTENPD